MTLDEAKELFPKQDLVNDFVGYIYVTFNIDEGLFYIGKRTRKTWDELYYGSGKIPQIWIKEGKKLDHWPIQWCFTKKEINEAEFNWIEKFKNHKDIVNLVKGGGSFVPMNDKLNEEKNELLRKKFKGIPLTENTKRKMSESKKEFYKTHDVPMKGRKHTEEAKKKMSKIAKIRCSSPNYVHNQSKSVRCIETGEIFKSTIEAAKSLGKKGSHIYDVCNGKREKALGYHWEWIKDE